MSSYYKNFPIYFKGYRFDPISWILQCYCPSDCLVYYYYFIDWSSLLRDAYYSDSRSHSHLPEKTLPTWILFDSWILSKS